jgi:hypothetical protein
MVNFISRHLIKKIQEEVQNKNKILNCTHFLYFDQIIEDPKTKINRVDKYNPYPAEEILPLSWYFLSPKTLVTIYQNIKNNNFYTYKSIEGKSHKIRIKNKK